jgi:hypothetical protein
MSEQEFETAFEEHLKPEELPEPEAPDESPVEPEAPETYEIEGRTFTKDELDPVLRFTEWAKANPDAWQQMQDWEAGKLRLIDAQEPAPEPVYEPQEPTEEPDYYSEEYLKGLGERQRQLEAEIRNARASEAQGAVDAGIQSFASAHDDLSKEDVNKVLKWVHDSNVLTAIPDNLPYASKAQAVADRFEEGYRVVFYDRVKAESTRQTVNDLNKRRRAASSSSSASQPRVKPAPSTPEERKAAFTDAIAQALNEAT